jgi:hypothetical protein
MYNAIEVWLNNKRYIVALGDSEIEDVNLNDDAHHEIVQDWLYSAMSLEYKLIELDDDNEEIE